MRRSLSGTQFFLSAGFPSGLRARVETRKPPRGSGREEGGMRQLNEMFRYIPKLFFCRHPVPPVKVGEIDRFRKRAKRPLAPEIEIVVEVAHRQLAQ